MLRVSSGSCQLCTLHEFSFSLPRLAILSCVSYQMLKFESASHKLVCLFRCGALRGELNVTTHDECSREYSIIRLFTLYKLYKLFLKAEKSLAGPLRQLFLALHVGAKRIPLSKSPIGYSSSLHNFTASSLDPFTGCKLLTTFST